jgi:hypothetical protein
MCPSGARFKRRTPCKAGAIRISLTYVLSTSSRSRKELEVNWGCRGMSKSIPSSKSSLSPWYIRTRYKHVIDPCTRGPAEHNTDYHHYFGRTIILLSRTPRAGTCCLLASKRSYSKMLYDLNIPCNGISAGSNTADLQRTITFLSERGLPQTPVRFRLQ